MPIPSTPPTPEQLEQPRARLSELMHNLTVELMRRQADLLRAADSSEFAAAILRTADKLAEASVLWAAMSSTIRESWRI